MSTVATPMVATLCSCGLFSADVCTGGYNFKVPLTLESEKDTVSIGDTLRLIAEFSDVLYDTVLKKTINYPQGSISFNVNIYEFDPQNPSQPVSVFQDFPSSWKLVKTQRIIHPLLQPFKC